MVLITAEMECFGFLMQTKKQQNTKQNAIHVNSRTQSNFVFKIQYLQPIPAFLQYYITDIILVILELI